MLIQWTPGLQTIQQTAKKAPAALAQHGQAVPDRLDIRFGNSTPPKLTPVTEFVASLKKRGVLVPGGGGTMGSGIAMNCLNAGFPVHIHEGADKFVQKGTSFIQGELKKAAERGLISQDNANQTLALLKDGYTNQTMDAIPPDTGLVIEAIFEDEAAKKGLFKKLDAHLGPDAILASNTSSISIDRLADGLTHPERFIGIHFFLPAHRNRFIEIIPGKKTSQDTVDKTMALVRALGKTPILCKKDAAGFAINRLLVPWINEGPKILEDMTAAYEKQHGAKPDQEMVKKMVTTIDTAAKELIWPTVSKNAKNSAILLTPFVALNMPVYTGIMADIGNILQKDHGNAYLPPKTVLDNAQKFADLKKQNPPDFNEQYKKLQYPMGGPESVMADQLPAIKDRFMGLIIGIAGQMLDEGVASPEDINRGFMIGTRWEMPIFETINSMGAKKALSLVEQYQKTNPDFKIPKTLVDMAAHDAQFDINYVDTRKDGPTQYITLNKPQRNNAIDIGMIKSLEKALDKAEADPTVKTIVFESIGGKHFCTGMDIFALRADLAKLDGEVRKKMQGQPPEAVQQALTKATVDRVAQILDPGLAFLDKLTNSSKVTVAKVNGSCLGGGAELALACDYVAAADEANIGFPEIKHGLIPLWNGTENLPGRVGPTMAKFMTLEGSLMSDKGKGAAFLNGQQAKAVGFAHLTAPAVDLDHAVSEALAQGQFAQKPKRPQTPDELQQRDREVLSMLQAKGDGMLLNRYTTYQNLDKGTLLDTQLKPLLAPVQKLMDEVDAAVNGLKPSLKALDDAALGGDPAVIAQRNEAREKLLGLIAKKQQLEKTGAKAQAIYGTAIDVATLRLEGDRAAGLTPEVRSRDFQRIVTNMMAMEGLNKQLKAK